jgi:hypothetical protein
MSVIFPSYLHVKFHIAYFPTPKMLYYTMLINHKSCVLFRFLSRILTITPISTLESSTKSQPAIRIPRPSTWFLHTLALILRRRRPTKLNPQLRIPGLRHNRRSCHTRNTRPLRYRCRNLMLLLIGLRWFRRLIQNLRRRRAVGGRARIIRPRLLWLWRKCQV